MTSAPDRTVRTVLLAASATGLIAALALAFAGDPLWAALMLVIAAGGFGAVRHHDGRSRQLAGGRHAR